MKKLYTLLVVSLVVVTAKAQIVNIPDANFKAKLITLGVDTNADGEIQTSEALAQTSLNLNNAFESTFISDLTGLEAFTNLQSLAFYYHNFTSLNVSSLTNLQSLSVRYTQITSLDVSNLTNLQTLDCSFNPISTLNVSGLLNLQSLDCHNDNLSVLNVSGLTGLHDLICYNNFLTSLDVSGLTNLKKLYSYSNQLTTLNVAGLQNLQILGTAYNQLTTLNVSGLTSLTDFDCAYNQLTVLDVSGLPTVTTLYCHNNHIHTLDVSSLINLSHLSCTNNNLSTLFAKNGKNEYISFYEGNSIDYICADESQVAALQSQMPVSCSFCLNLINSYCSFTPGGPHYVIHGNTRLDIDANGCDANDIPFPDVKFELTDGTLTGHVSNSSSNYSIPVQAGTHTITPILENPTYYTISPSTATVTFPTATSPHTQNFCITANGIHSDLEVALLPSRNARPGFDATYIIIYKNKGNITQSGTVNLTFDDSILDYVSATPSVTTQVTNSLVWAFSNLLPFETRTIVVTLNVNSPLETPAVNLGNVLHYTATVNEESVDETPSDNTIDLAQIVVNSLDPNEKKCVEGTTITPEMVGEYVHYVVGFENDGTAEAQNVVVMDRINTTKFDINTLVPLSGSASYTTRITDTNKVEFIFENINLPFAAGSNTGYVAFKIKTKPTLVVGDTFSNSANIYFDYNYPIVTNTATTTVQTLATQDFDFGHYFSVYPVPAKQVLHLQTKVAIGVKLIEIYNVVGQLVIAIPNAESVSAIDVSNLKAGTYFIKVTTDKGMANAKFVKE